jgi:hypothetical protein
MVTLRVISATGAGDPTLVVDHDTSVLDTRGMVAAVLGIDVERVKLNFRGRLLQDDETMWTELSPQEGEKLYVAADSSTLARQPMNTHGSVASSRLGSNSVRPDASGGGGGMPSMPPAVADVVLNSLTPETIAMMMSSIPELRNLERDHPEAARELRDPDNFRAMLRAQMDPTLRRAQHQAQGAQLAQLGAIPGGWQMAERMVHSMQRDDRREGDEDPDAMSSSTAAMPVAGQLSNNEPLPNPWARTAPPAPQPQPQPQPQHRPTAPAPLFTQPAATGGSSQPRPTQPRAEPRNAASAASVDRGVKVLVDEMGFDPDTARLALEQAGGDVDAAVNLIAQWTE